jgi:hypothetical protein
MSKRSVKMVSFQSNSMDSIYSLDLHIPSPQVSSLSTPNENSDDSRARRRQDLLGLVNNLDLEMRMVGLGIGMDIKPDWDKSESSGNEDEYGIALASSEDGFEESGSEYAEEEDETDDASYISTPKPPAHSIRDSHNYESILMATNSRAAAAREREALGIPPSESAGPHMLSHAESHPESVMSSVDSELWDDAGSQGSSELSRGAEEMFRKLSRPPLARHGSSNSELHRAIVIFRNSEVAYVSKLAVVLDLFILPLRLKDSKAWIPGVPSPVASLLDWMEDIYQLHLDMLSILDSREQEGLSVNEVMMRLDQEIVKRLEVYLPFLLRHTVIGEVLEDRGSDFGEFVRIQEEEDGGRVRLKEVMKEPERRLGTMLEDLQVISFTYLYTKLSEFPFSAF